MTAVCVGVCGTASWCGAELTCVCMCVVVVVQGKEREQVVAAAKQTKEFKGYTNYGQLKWLDRSIVCVDFDLDAKQRVLELEAQGKLHRR